MDTINTYNLPDISPTFNANLLKKKIVVFNVVCVLGMFAFPKKKKKAKLRKIAILCIVHQKHQNICLF